MSSRGFNAWAVSRCMSYHLNKNIPYDGWEYNFKSSKLTVDKYVEQIPKSCMYSYSMIERECPTHLDLIKFWYPLFRFMHYQNPSTIIKQAREWHKQYLKYVAAVEEQISSVDPDMSIGINGLPNIYNKAQKSVVDYFLVVAMFLKFPQLNTIASKDPLGLYNDWLQQVNIDKKFLSLYIAKDLVC